MPDACSFSPAPPLDWTAAAPISVPWGDGSMPLGMPEEWPVFCAHPAAELGHRHAAPDLPNLLAAALANPIDSSPLAQMARQVGKSDGRIAIVVDDNTRPTPADRILPVLLEQIGAGSHVPDDRIEIHFAGGLHTPMTREQMIAKVGSRVVERFACFNNIATDRSQYRYLGRTRTNTPVHLSRRVADAQLRVLIGSVSAHLQAGFAGGLKLLFPGMSTVATIRKLHLHGTRRFRQLIGLPAQHNPMRQEIDRLFEFVPGQTFALQLLLDGRGNAVYASAGHAITAQRVLADRGERTFGAALPGQADLLVTNSYPREHDLWQCFKCIANTLFACRPGGVIVALMKADHGSNGMKVPKWPLSARMLRRLMWVFGRTGLISILSRVLPQLNDEARFFARFCLGTIRRNDVLIYSPSLAAEGLRFPGLEIFDSLPAVWRRAAELLPSDRPRVTVFANGGECYPLESSWT